ncbi:MAG: hypothetical protein KBA95_01885 [Acidobacteria bacterium]|nr:hypothetical protein [Acidobacteriota bacterium]
MAGLKTSVWLKVSGITEARKQLRELPKEAIAAFGEASYATALEAEGRAEAAAPVRRQALGPYRGGALRQRIGSARLRPTGEASIGIEKGLVSVRMSGRLAGRQTWVMRERYYKREKVVSRGKRKGFYYKTGRKMLLRQDERAKVMAAGSRFIQPTRYGHLVEFGRKAWSRPNGRRSPAITGRRFLRNAVEQSQPNFLSRMRAAAQASEAHLAAMGHQA